MIYVVDNAIPKIEQDRLEELVKEMGSFPWFLKGGQLDNPQTWATTGEEEKIPWLVHYTVEDSVSMSQYTQLSIDPILEVLNNLKFTNTIIRQVRFNLTLRALKKAHSGVHADGVKDTNYTALYYINDNDGATNLYDDEYNLIRQVDCKKGRMVIFPAETNHAAVQPVNSMYKILLNYNFYAEPPKQEEQSNDR